jgi:hypothetical protein
VHHAEPLHLVITYDVRPGETLVPARHPIPYAAIVEPNKSRIEFPFSVMTVSACLIYGVIGGTGLIS